MLSKLGRRSAGVVMVLAAATVATNTAAASASSFGASWQLNEKSGAVVDSSGNHNNGTVHGGVIRTGSGYRFNGSTGYLSVPNSPSLNPGSAPITLTVKFSLDGNPSPSGYDYDIVRKGLAGTAGGDYKMEVLSNGQALCRFRGTNAGTVQGGTNLGTGTHVVRCVKTSSSVRLIIDGVTKTTKTVKVGSISNAQPVILAAKPGDDFTKGFIDYFTIT